jgi:hypothetical protein
MAFWNAAQSSNDCDAVRAYLQRFPRGIFVELAKLSERRLCAAGRKVSVVEPAASEAASSSTAAATLTPVAPVPDATVIASKPAPVVVAAVPDMTIAPPSASVPAILPSATDLTRVIQLELYRLGCGSSEADGKWTVVTREGLRKFNLRTKSKLDTNEPSGAIVAALQKQNGRICPIECGRGMVLRGETCVAVAKPAPKKQLRRAERNTRSAAPARVRHREPAPATAAAAPQPTHTPVPMMGAPLGGMMFFGFGGRRRW